MKKIRVKDNVVVFRATMDSMNQRLYNIENEGLPYNKVTSLTLIGQITKLIDETLALEDEAKKVLRLKEDEAIGRNKYNESIRRTIRQCIDMRKHLYLILQGLVDRQIQIATRENIEWNK